MNARAKLGVAVAVLVAAACGSEVTGLEQTSSGGQDGAGGNSGAGAGSTASQSGGSTGSGPPIVASCFDAPPDGSPAPPAAKAYSGGRCPTLQAGVNVLPSGGADRQFYLALPSDLAPGESLPVVFLWHWMGGDMMDFYDKGDVQTAVDHFRFAAAIPNEKGDLQFKWPVEIIASSARIDEEVTFFDDMLACVSQQYTVNDRCVSSIGVSAGALWTPVLAHHRGDYLASIVSLSGGSGGFIQSWQGSPKKMPAMVLWGGPSDNCFGLMNFVQTSNDLETHLTEDGHFLVECVHNCGHAPPPFAVPGAATAFEPMWNFVLQHPYWLEAGTSPFAHGLPADMPEWCGIGMGSATPREGECTEEPGC